MDEYLKSGDEKLEPTKDGEKKLSLEESVRRARMWSRELAASKKWMDRFTASARKCEKAYFEDGLGQGGGLNTDGSDKAGKVNLFWSNVQVILAAIYGRLPKAEVDRKFKDYNDDVSRVAALIMQRILNADIEREHNDANAAMRDAVQDRFIAGLGQVWCRYEVEITTEERPMIDPMSGQPFINAETGQPAVEQFEKIADEDAPVDYVNWEDFRYSPCRRWRDVRWVARRNFMSEKALKKRFKLTPEQLSMIPLQVRMTDGGEDDVLKATPFKQAAVWEIWNRDGEYACWYVEGCSFLLDYRIDPLQLEGFFPCPQPIVATTLTKAFLPRPDYAMAQDLYRELDKVNRRISLLTDAVKAAAVYDKNAGPLKLLLTSGSPMNAMLPADNWSAFVEKGGMKGAIDWMPIEQFSNAILQLQQRKGQLERDLYEVLGISDIMRGASVASETATAQQLKVQYGGARLANLQNEVARFVSAVMRIRANIISNHFQPETIVRRSLIDRTPDAQMAQPAIEMLKDFGVAMLSVKVTADSLAAPDWQSEKEARTEFLGAASNYIMAAGPMVQQAPQVGSFLMQLLQWAAAGFKGASTIEGVLDQAARQLEQQAQQPQPPKEPSAEDRKNEAQAKKYGAEAEKTAKEAALIPPMFQPPGGGMPPPGGPGGPPGGPPPGAGMPPPGAPPGGPGGLPAAPGTVPPLMPQEPLPPNPM